jgi:hypothetical protein
MGSAMIHTNIGGRSDEITELTERLMRAGASAIMGIHADVAQLVERDLAKVEVAGSSPVVRSKRSVATRTLNSVTRYVTPTRGR